MEPNKNDKENLAWKEIRTEHIVQDKWIDFRRSDYRLPDGNIAGPFYSYSRKDHVVIVASDENGNYICVRQFRQGIKEVTTEFPAGGIEYAEDALGAAKRELREETGHISDKWEHLLTVPSNATIADNYAHIFTAKDCRRSGAQSLDGTEFLHIKKYPAAKIDGLICKGSFQQAVHIMAWLLSQRI